jgi:choline kinase
MGSRMGMGVPKCLIEVGGRPIIAHLLDRLAGVADVRIVVGHDAANVIRRVKDLRRDVTFVVNPSYRMTTTLHSYMMGGAHIEAPALYMDADILFEPASFAGFLAKAGERPDSPLIAVTEAKTEDCVYAHLDKAGRIVSFSREEKGPFEWANLAWLPPGVLEDKPCAVYEQLSTHLPLQAEVVVSYEMDTPQDYEQLKAAYQDFARQA